MSTFSELSLPTFLLERLTAQNITTPTEIQAAAIPLILEGKDCIAQSHTGTGKTLSYLLPILARLDAANPNVQAMVVAPSQELGIQIIEEVRKLTADTPIVSLQLIGGANIRHQIERLKKHPQIVVGTPGRMAELIQTNRLKLSGLRYLIIDEVDQVLAFEEGMLRIKKSLPRDRQTLFVSATISAASQEAATRWMKEINHVEIKGAGTLPDSIQHHYVTCEARDKTDVLRRLVHASKTRSAIIFLNEGYKLEEVFTKLSFKGLVVTALAGDVSKEARAAALKAFRVGASNLLLTTELGARGLDIKGVSHVFNLGLPTDADHYLHRAGRCGRLGQIGTVISIVTPNEQFVIEKFAKALGITITPVELSYGKVSSPKPASDSPQKKRPFTAKPHCKKTKGEG